jgi:uncharacterized membrane protein YbjE (DUF340 family)
LEAVRLLASSTTTSTLAKRVVQGLTTAEQVNRLNSSLIIGVSMESRISFQAGLVDLMNLFIGWGLQIQKQKWLDRVGYR